MAQVVARLVCCRKELGSGARRLQQSEAGQKLRVVGRIKTYAPNTPQYAPKYAPNAPKIRPKYAKYGPWV